MLSSSDAALVQREPALPGLATLLDPEAFKAEVCPLFPAQDLGAVSISYIRYKPGTSCLVGYCLDVGEEQVTLTAHTYRLDAHDKLQKARQKALRLDSCHPGNLIVEDRGLVIAVFPHDSKLKALCRLVDTNARQHLLRKLVRSRPDLWEATVHSLTYKPKRRYVGQLQTKAGPQAILKMHTEWGYQTAGRNAAAFVSRGPLQIAPLLGYSDRWHTIVLEWLPGRLLSEALADPQPPYERVLQVGAALAALHAQHPDGLPLLTRSDETTSLMSLAVWLGDIYPAVSEYVQSLAQRLAAALLREPQLTAPIHGDFYAQQVLLSDDRVAILDLDEAKYGDPAADLGLFIAHLERDVLRGTLTGHAVQPIQERFFKGYQAATGCPVSTRVALYTAVGLFRLAPDPFRHREPDWPERIQAILARVAAILDDG